MRRYQLAIAAALGMAIVPQGVSLMHEKASAVPELQVAVRRKRRTGVHYGGAAHRKWRSKGPAARPKKRPNMRLISSRVRRKHRRSARR